MARGLGKLFRQIGNLGQDIGSGVIDYLSPRDERRAANQAAEAQRQATEQAQQLTEQRFQEAEQFQQPYLQAGQQTFFDVLQGLKSGQFNAPEPPRVQDFAALTQRYMQRDPGADFRMREAQRAIESSAAARGTRLGSGVLEAMNQRIQDLASQEYGAQYGRAAQAAGSQIQQQQNRYDQIRDNLNQYFQRLQGFASMGPQTAMNLANQRIGLAGQQAGFTQDIGNISAANIAAKQEAKNAAMSNIANIAGTGLGYALGASTGSPQLAAMGGQMGRAMTPQPYQPAQTPENYTNDQLSNMWRLGYPGAQ